MEISDESEAETTKLQQIISRFYPFAKEYLDFGDDPNVVLRSDDENSRNFLGKTAFYEPDSLKICLYVDNRHPKDILRSFSHELVHHSQNCRGEFDKKYENCPQVGENGYAQNNPHLRGMEKEAYLTGNIMFRDWCDGLSAEFSIILLESEEKMQKKQLKSGPKQPKSTKKEPKKPLKQWYYDSLYDNLVKKWVK
jgi:hypothetical protein